MVTTAINAAMRGIDVTQAQTTIAMENLQNVDNPHYKRKNIKLDSTDIVDNRGINVNIDRFLSAELQGKISKSTYLDTLDSNLQYLAEFFGDPASDHNMIGRITQVFANLQVLASEPHITINKNEALNKLDHMANSITNIAHSLYSLRHQVDQEISFVINDINNNLKIISELKGFLDSHPKGTHEYVNAQTGMDKALKELAESMEVQSGYDYEGNFYVKTAASISLADDLAYELQYTPQKSVEDIISGVNFSPIEVAVKKGEQIMPKKILLTPKLAGIEPDYTSIGGRLGGLLEMRDRIIPTNLDRLDSLAVTLKENFNRLHNLGTGFPPAAELRANRAISREDAINFAGKVVVAAIQDTSVIDSTGHTTNLITSSGIAPLELDFSNLNTGAGAGQANIEGLLEEINYNFNQRITSSTAQLAGLSDIRLVSLSSGITAGGTLNLALEVDNFSNHDIGVQITGITAVDAISTNLNPIFTSPTTAFGTSLASQRQGSISLTNPLINNYPYTVTVDYAVTEEGISKNYTVTYKIEDPDNNVLPYNNLTNGIMNARFSPRQAIDDNNQNVLKAAISQSGLLEATLVDAEGNLISASDKKTAGFIKITSKADKWHVGIQDKGSSFLGERSLIQGQAASFSHHFGLNDLFVRTDGPKNWSDNKNTSLYLDLRQDIKNQKTGLATGRLQQVAQSSIPQARFDFNYEIAKGDGELALQMARLQDYSLSFYRADYQTTVNFSLREYTTNTIASVSVIAQNTKIDLEISQTQVSALEDRISSSEGVNLNLEVLNLIALQNKHAALTNAIKVANDMFAELIAVFR